MGHNIFGLHITTINNLYCILFAITPMAWDYGFILQTLGMGHIFQIPKLQTRSLRIMIRAIHHSDMYWNEMIEPLSISRSISKLHAQTKFCSLVDTHNSNEILAQIIEVNSLKKINKFNISNTQKLVSNLTLISDALKMASKLPKRGGGGNRRR